MLRFNIDKCHVMHIDRKVKAKYYLKKDNKRWEIAESEVGRDMGIWVSNDINWKTQDKKAAAQAMSVLGMIRRTFPSVDVDGFKLLYNVYIRPHLEFCVQAWSPYFKKNIDCMENVQHGTTKVVYGVWNLKYEERLNLFYNIGE